jgi:outer membrane receptor protein involved in Fe transport
MSYWLVRLSLFINYFVFAILLNSVGTVILQVQNTYGVSESDASVLEAFTVQLAADNLTDEDALTESDPRTIAAPNGRYIMPRTFTLSVGYEF